jgi:hypothetical protein
VDRGLKGVDLIVSDACRGLVESVAEFLPGARWQRCVAHFYRNVFSRVPAAKVREVSHMLKAIHGQEARAALPRYQRLTGRAEALIASVYLAGANTRLGKRALFWLFQGAVSKDVVSRTWRKVKVDREAWCARSLAEEDIVRLVLDGTVIAQIFRMTPELSPNGRDRRRPARPARQAGRAWRDRTVSRRRGNVRVARDRRGSLRYHGLPRPARRRQTEDRAWTKRWTGPSTTACSAAASAGGSSRAGPGRRHRSGRSTPGRRACGRPRRSCSARPSPS